MNQDKVYENLYSDIGFDRRGLFELLNEKYHSRNVLYPGCSMHITPSFVFQHVTYIDKSKEANDFFADNQAIRQIIENKRMYKTSPNFRFLSFNYKTEHLPLEDMSFDLLISLYADNIIESCKRYVRNNGIIICNNFHDEALEAKKYKDLILIAYIKKTKTKYVLYNDNLDTALKHRDEEKIQKMCMKKRSGSIWYEDRETYFVFQVTR